jgi:hypothetical protein
MKINSINNINNKKLDIKTSLKSNKFVQQSSENDLKSPVDAQLYQAYNNVSFKALKPIEKKVLISI